MKIIKQIQENLKFRKQKKETYDKIVEFSNTTNGEWNRLLDEGFVFFGDGSIRNYIQKGVLAEYYNSLDDDFVGYIKATHDSLFNINLVTVGKFTKKDLRLVDIGDGRQGLDVRFNLDYNNILLNIMQQGAEILGSPLSISAEFECTYNDALTEKLSGDFGEYAPVIDRLFINGFAFTDDPANVNSYDVNFTKGEKSMTEKEILTTEDAEVKEETEDTNATEDTKASEDTELKGETEKSFSNEEIAELKGKIEELNNIVSSLQATNEKLSSEVASQKELFSNINISTNFQSEEVKPEINKNIYWR